MLILKKFGIMKFLESKINKKTFRGRASKRDGVKITAKDTKSAMKENNGLSSANPLCSLRYILAFLLIVLVASWEVMGQKIDSSAYKNKATKKLISQAPLEGGQTHLDQYLQEAAQNNPEIKAKFRQYLSALQQVPQVNTLPDPELSFGYFISPIETRVGPQQVRFGLTQMFPWFGTLGARGAAATQMAKAKFEAFQDQRNKLFYEVQEKWYQLYRLDQTIDILQENIEILETFESVTLQKYETDQVGQADVLRVQIEKEDLKTRLELEKDNRDVAAGEFNALLNRKQDRDIAVADTLHAEALSRSEAELEQAVREQNPQLTKTEYEMASARSSLKVARKAGMPKFGIGIDYMVTGNRSMSVIDNGRDAILARAGIQLPLFRGKYRAQKKQAQIQLQAVEDRREAAANRLEIQLDQALRDYHEGQRRIKLYKEVQIQRTRQAIQILTEEYAAAATDFEELLRLQRKLLDYELARDQALVKQNSAVARIEYLYGKYNVNPEEIEIAN